MDDQGVQQDLIKDAIAKTEPKIEPKTDRRTALVAVKRVVDHRLRVRLHEDGRGLDTASLKHAMNPFDAIALEAAVRLKTSGFFSHIHVVTIGDAVAEDILRHALAVGADQATHGLWAGTISPQPLQVAHILHALIQRDPTVVCALLGKQAIDTNNHQTGPMLAGLWGVPQLTAVSHLEPHADQTGVQARCERHTGLEFYQVDLPCVITVDLGLNTPRYPSLPKLLQAKKMPIDQLIAEDMRGAIPRPDPMRSPCGWHTACVDRKNKVIQTLEALQAIMDGTP